MTGLLNHMALAIESSSIGRGRGQGGVVNLRRAAGPGYLVSWACTPRRLRTADKEATRAASDVRKNVS